MVRWKDEAKKRGFTSIHDMLFRLYIIENLSASLIGVELNVTGQTVRNALRLHKITIKKRGGYKKCA